VASGGLSATGGTNGIVVGNLGSGLRTVDAGGTVDESGVFIVGNGGAGTLVVQGGRVDQTGRDFDVGTGAEGHCTIVVDGHASSMLLVEGGGLLSSTRSSGTAGVIHATGSAAATATVSGGTWLLAGGNFTIGAFTADSLDVNGGGGIGVVNAGTNEIDIGQFGSAAHGTASVETGGPLLGGQLGVSDATGATTGVLNIGAGGLVEVANVSDKQGGDITVGGRTAAAELSSSGLFGIGQIGADVTLTIGSLGTMTGTGGNTLEVLSGSTVAVNGGTLGGFGDVDVGAFGADSPGTLVSPAAASLRAPPSRWKTAACYMPAA
jgi:hypothetical protein